MAPEQQYPIYYHYRNMTDKVNEAKSISDKYLKLCTIVLESFGSVVYTDYTGEEDDCC